MSRRSCQYSVIWPICSDGTIHPYVVNKQRQFFLLFLGHCGNCPRDSSRHENIVHNKYILLFITCQPPYYKNETGHNLQPGSINKLMRYFSLLSSSTPLRYKQKKTQDYYSTKYTFPFCQKMSIWIFLICQNLWEFPACSAEALLPVLWGMIPNVGLS